jgi:hypothetical protein
MVTRGAGSEKISLRLGTPTGEALFGGGGVILSATPNVAFIEGAFPRVTPEHRQNLSIPSWREFSTASIFATRGIIAKRWLLLALPAGGLWMNWIVRPSISYWSRIASRVDHLVPDSFLSSEGIPSTVNWKISLARHADWESTKTALAGTIRNENPIFDSASANVSIARCFRPARTWLSMSSVSPVAWQKARRVLKCD